MADFSESKKFGTQIYPVESSVTTNLFGRIEPLITVDQLLSRYLKAQIADVTRDYTPDELKDEINLAVNEFELLSHLTVNPVQYRERIPFDRDLYRSFVYMKTNNGPILSVEEILIESSYGENIYKLPADWIEAGYFHKRQINLIPILSIFGAAGLKDGQASNSGLIFLQAINKTIAFRKDISLEPPQDELDRFKQLYNELRDEVR